MPDPFAKPALWGPGAWRFLECMAMTYPTKPRPADIARNSAFVRSFGKQLPCKICKKHYEEYVSKHFSVKKDLATRRAFITFIIRLHNNVNRITGKRVYNTKGMVTLFCMAAKPASQLSPYGPEFEAIRCRLFGAS